MKSGVGGASWFALLFGVAPLGCPPSQPQILELSVEWRDQTWARELRFETPECSQDETYSQKIMLANRLGKCAEFSIVFECPCADGRRAPCAPVGGIEGGGPGEPCAEVPLRPFDIPRREAVGK
jgi:hypothetical protein